MRIYCVTTVVKLWNNDSKHKYQVKVSHVYFPIIKNKVVGYIQVFTFSMHSTLKKPVMTPLKMLSLKGFSIIPVHLSD